MSFLRMGEQFEKEEGEMCGWNVGCGGQRWWKESERNEKKKKEEIEGEKKRGRRAEA